MNLSICRVAPHRASLLATAVALALAAAVPSSFAYAQGAAELGTDASVQTVLSSGPSVTTVSIPSASFRAGLYFAPALSLEPRVGFISTSGGGTTATVYAASLSALLHFPTSQIGIGPYLRPFVGFTGASSGGSVSQTSAGIGFGASLPLSGGLATRLEVNYAHAFSSSDFDSANAIGASIGLSYFLR